MNEMNELFKNLISDDLIGKKVRVLIKEPETYAKDLYESIHNQVGTIIKKQGDKSLYKNAYLVEFSVNCTKNYAKTHNGAWGGLDFDDPNIKPMAWWTERENFEIV
jgi:hypothetical protein